MTDKSLSEKNPSKRMPRWILWSILTAAALIVLLVLGIGITYLTMISNVRRIKVTSDELGENRPAESVTIGDKYPSGRVGSSGRK